MLAVSFFSLLKKLVYNVRNFVPKIWVHRFSFESIEMDISQQSKSVLRQFLGIWAKFGINL